MKTNTSVTPIPKNILLLHGPNLNRLGTRDPAIYGTLTLRQLEKHVATCAATHGYVVLAHQSNHEGDLIDILQKQANHCAGIIINPGALAHYSYALYDALLDTGRPAIEVHLSNIKKREPFRKLSVTANACLTMICGQKEKGYTNAVQQLVEHLTCVDPAK